MVTGYNTITITSLGILPLEVQKKIVAMYNSNNKPLLLRLEIVLEGAEISFSTLLSRVHSKILAGDEIVYKRGYYGHTDVGEEVFIDIKSDGSVELNTDPV